MKKQTQETEKRKKFLAFKEKCDGHYKEIFSTTKENILLFQKLQYDESVARILQDYQKNLSRTEKLKLAQFFSTKSE